MRNEIKRTVLPKQHIVVVTVQLVDPHLIRQFRTFARDDLSGDSARDDFATAAAALQRHAELVRNHQIGRRNR